MFVFVLTAVNRDQIQHTRDMVLTQFRGMGRMVYSFKQWLRLHAVIVISIDDVEQYSIDVDHRFETKPKAKPKKGDKTKAMRVVAFVDVSSAADVMY